MQPTFRPPPDALYIRGNALPSPPNLTFTLSNRSGCGHTDVWDTGHVMMIMAMQYVD